MQSTVQSLSRSRAATWRGDAWRARRPITGAGRQAGSRKNSLRRSDLQDLPRRYPPPQLFYSARTPDLGGDAHADCCLRLSSLTLNSEILSPDTVRAFQTPHTLHSTRTWSKEEGSSGGREVTEPQISRLRSLHPFFPLSSFLALVHLEVSLRTLRTFISSATALFVVGDPPGLGRHDGHLLPRAASRRRRRALLVAGVPALGLGEPVYLQSEEDVVVRSRNGCTEPAIRPT